MCVCVFAGKYKRGEIRVCVWEYLYIMYTNGLNKNNRCIYIYVYVVQIWFVRADTAYIYIYYCYRYLKSRVPVDFLNAENLLYYCTYNNNI